MTLEEKAQKIIADYEKKQERLGREYQKLFNAIDVNAWGEANATQTLEVNEWYKKQKEKLDGDFIYDMQHLKEVEI